MIVTLIADHGWGR